MLISKSVLLRLLAIRLDCNTNSPAQILMLEVELDTHTLTVRTHTHCTHTHSLYAHTYQSVFSHIPFLSVLAAVLSRCKRARCNPIGLQHQFSRSKKNLYMLVITNNGGLSTCTHPQNSPQGHQTARSVRIITPNTQIHVMTIGHYQ